MILHERRSVSWFSKLYTMTEIFAMSKILVYRDKAINFKRLLSLNITNTNAHIRTHPTSKGASICVHKFNNNISRIRSFFYLIAWSIFISSSLVWRKTNTSSICVFVSIFDDMLSCCQNKLWTLFFSRNW